MNWALFAKVTDPSCQENIAVSINTWRRRTIELKYNVSDHKGVSGSYGNAGKLVD